MRDPRPCPTCSEIFEPRHSPLGWTRFCSSKCAGASRRKLVIDKQCEECGGIVRPHRPSEKIRFCDRSCSARWKAKNRPEITAGMVSASVESRKRKRAKLDANLPGHSATVCQRPGCRNALTGQATIYCSARCHYSDRSRRGLRRAQPYHRCAACDVVFPWNGRGKGVYCSAECKKTGGRVSREPDVVEVVEVRGHARREFKDETAKCRSCGDRAVNQHHVVFRQHIERAGGDRWHPDDALALCFACHVSAHQGRLPLSTLRDENFAFAGELLGPAGFDYLMARYAGDDPRCSALLEVTA